MCHAERSHSAAYETTTRNHEPQCQYCDCGSAINYCQVNFSNDLSCTDLDRTNQSSLLSRPLPHNLNSDYQNKPQAVTIEVSQMQSNKSPTFVPKGRQGQTIPAHFVDRQFFEDHDLASRNISTPQLSYTSTPESLFSTSNHVQNFRDGHSFVTRFDTTDNGGGFVDATEKAMLAQYPKVRFNAHNTFKREFHGSSLDDGLSEPSHSYTWSESPSILALHDPQQSLYSNDQSFVPSAFSPHQSLSNDGNFLSPNHVYAQHNNGMQQQTPANVFEPCNSNDLFMLPPAANDFNSPFQVNNNAFSRGFGPSNYLAHARPFQGDFDFNNSAVYPTMQYATDYSPYGLPQAPNTLATQSAISSFAGQQPSKNRSRPKASDLDDLLIKWREKGVTYKDIMKRGDWGLSESTLRGRYRTLTKDKRLRPRKPQWDNAALSALVTAVDRFAPPTASSNRTTESGGKIPWKKVTEWMHDQKNTHKYGFATVKKKYEQLVGDRQMQREVNQWRLANGEHPFTR